MKLVAIAAFFFQLVLLSLSSPAAAATLYKIYGKRGAITFTTKKPTKGVRYTIIQRKQPLHSKFYHSQGLSLKVRRSRYDSLIRQVALNEKLDPALVKAIVHAESGFDPLATSRKGAMGLMQLMPQTAVLFGAKDAYHPEQNVKAGTKYLRKLLKRYHQDLRLALAAYNAGEEAVDRFNGVPPYAETQHYVKRVQGLFKAYRATHGSS